MPYQDDLPNGRVQFDSLARSATGAKRDASKIPDRDGSAARSAHNELRLDARLRPSGGQAWPAEIAFLAHYGVAPGALSAATAAAKQQGVSADSALLASGEVSEDHFYRSLARHLRLAFLDDDVELAAGVQYPQSVHAGVAPLVDPAGKSFLVAPRGAAIAHLILSNARGDVPRRLAITTPTHFAQLLRAAFSRRIRRDASYALPTLDPTFCAKGLGWRQRPGHLAGIFLLMLVFALDVAGSVPLCAILLGLALLPMAVLRLLASAAALEARPHARRGLSDEELPVYSVVIALYREARMVPQLIAALDALDYPPAKLEIKFVVEEDDAETLLALTRAIQSPLHEIIVAPAGAPRTKPRVLNVALPMLRGEYTTIFDAEDVPAPDQIRMAAERFAQAPQELACLQASLVIHNLDAGWLPQLFAIEYAALFDVVNPGLADLDLPFPLGGSSNHFRTSVLRRLGGWDAWNVTEDADIGFRFTRFGYHSETLPSMTLEEAPSTLQSFLGQRRRWCKGWYQTLGTLCRNPRRLWREAGPSRGMAMFLILVSSVLVPLGLPLFVLCLAIFAIHGGLPWPTTDLEVAEETLWTSVFFAGAAALLLPICLGMRRRGLVALWPKLLLLPVYYALISVAAWLGLLDLTWRPYHWCKTEHGVVSPARRRGRFSPFGRKAGRSIDGLRHVS